MRNPFPLAPFDDELSIAAHDNLHAFGIGHQIFIGNLYLTIEF